MKKSMFVIVFCVMIISCICIVNKVFENSNAALFLSQEEVNELRNKYPIIGFGSQLDLMEASVEETISDASMIIEGQVMDELKMDTSTVNDDVLDELGLPPLKIQTKRYKVKVNTVIIDNKDYGINVGDEIVLVYNLMDEGSMPKLDVESRFILPITKSERESGTYNEFIIYNYSIYYITDDDYVLNAYETTENQEKYTGLKREKLIEKFETIHKRGNMR